MNTAGKPAPVRVAFVGLGVMGGPMARHLVRAGHEVTVFNRTGERAQRWHQSAGGTARIAPTPQAAAAAAEIVFVCVGNDADVGEVVLGAHGALGGMKPGGVLVDHSTVSADLARRLDGEARTRGLHFIDAPVSGGQVGAENGVLTVMCGGAEEPFERVRPVMASYARTIKLLGPAGSGQLAKMVNQICIAGVLQGLSEAIAFGQKAGLDMAGVLEVISQGAARSWQMENRGPTMIEDRFEFGFAVDWMRKDLGLVLNESRRNGARVPLTALVDQFYADVQAAGGGRWDTSSLIRRLR